MPVTIADGPLGLEATHTWAAFTLNDTESGLPRAKVDRITGLHSLPEAEDTRRPRTARPGEHADPSFTRGKTVVYEGRLQAGSLQSLRALAQEMRAAFRERSSEGIMAVAPHPDYGTIVWEYGARVLQLDIDDQQQVGPSHMPTVYERPFTLGLRMSDPRFYLASDPTTTIPVLSGATITVTNEGEADTDRFSVAGDVDETVVTLENLSVGTSNGTARLRFDFTNLLVATASTLTVDFDARTAVLTYSGVDIDAVPYLDTDYSQWWDEFIPALQPGSNSVKATGLGGWIVTYSSATL